MIIFVDYNNIVTTILKMTNYAKPTKFYPTPCPTNPG